MFIMLPYNCSPGKWKKTPFGVPCFDSILFSTPDYYHFYTSAGATTVL